MANHVRQQIREQVGTMLTGLVTTGSRVHQSRVFDIESGSTPALIIYTTTEQSERDTMQNGMMRTLNLTVEGYAKGNSFDDTLDTISKEVEVAIGADPTLNNLSLDSVLVSTEMNLIKQGTAPAGVVTLTYSVDYRTTQSAPDVAL